MPFRSYRAGYVFRNEKPPPGWFRQFMQFDADTVGSASMAADAEMRMLAADTMEALGIPRGSYVVKVNNRKVLDGVLDLLGIAPDKRLTTMRAIDKLDRLGVEGVRLLLGQGRRDESGDFTKGAELGDSQVETIVGAITGASTGGNGPGEAELAEIEKLVGAAGYSDRVKIDKTVVRGLEYYTGPVYEVELLIETKDEKGRPVRFGSVGGGGRYDGLVVAVHGPASSSDGLLHRRVAAASGADAHRQARRREANRGPVVVTLFDKDRIADYQAMVAKLRNAGVRSELYLGNPKHSVGQQLKYADKRGAPCAVIQGPDEKGGRHRNDQGSGGGRRPGHRRKRPAGLPAKADRSPGPLCRKASWSKRCKKSSLADGYAGNDWPGLRVSRHTFQSKGVSVDRWSYPVPMAMQRHTGCRLPPPRA